MNWICFTLKSLSSAERPVPSPIGMGRIPIELENHLSAKEVYLLDKRASIEIECFVSLRGHCTCTAMAELMTFRLWKRDAIFHCHITSSACRSPSALAAQNVKGQRVNQFGICLKHTPVSQLCSSRKQVVEPLWSSPSGPLGGCNFNEK